MYRKLTSLLMTVMAFPAPALAWGYQGHETIAAIARAYLSGDVRSRVDAILARDPVSLTGTDMIARSTWPMRGVRPGIARRRNGTSLISNSIVPI